MGGHQEKSCENCRFEGLRSYEHPCYECTGAMANHEWSRWQSKRGRTKGTKSKPGTKKPGPIPKPSGEKMCFPVLSIKGKDLEAYGGIETLKADVKLMVETKLK